MLSEDTHKPLDGITVAPNQFYKVVAAKFLLKRR